MKILAAACLLLVLLISIRSKTRLRARRVKTGFELPVEPLDSQLSIALAELIATAGGIYVSLLLLFSFLDLSLPGKMVVLGIQVDSLATISLGVALLQPIIVAIFRRRVL